MATCVAHATHVECATGVQLANRQTLRSLCVVDLNTDYKTLHLDEELLQREEGK